MSLLAVKRFDETSLADREKPEDAIRSLLEWIGEDPDREGLRDTPRRVVEAWREMFGGYLIDPEEVLSKVFEDVDGYDDIVLLRDVDFTSHCEHHIAPFAGKAHVAYLPDRRVAGLSKLARTVDAYARRLQTQETMTAQIASAIEKALKPKGVAILIEATHQCMSMRGVRRKDADTVTMRFTGTFKDDLELRERFLGLARRVRPPSPA